MTHIARTDQELGQLAKRLYRGQIFGSWQVHSRDTKLLTWIFMPLFFMTAEQREELTRDGITHLYGEVDSALERSLNGYPCFASIGLLTQTEYETLMRKAEAIRAAVDAAA